MRRTAWVLSLMCAGVLAGCAEQEREVEAEAEEVVAEVVIGSAASPTPAAKEEPRERDRGGVSEQRDDASVVRNAVHPIAGRSAFPESGEVLDKPIAARRLSDSDQFGEAIDPSAIPEIVPWQQAGRYMGYEITAEGKIIDIGQSRDGKVNFLNFHRDWRGKFYLVVFDDLAKTLPKSVSDTFRDRTVRVRGVVEDHRGRPQIKILSMDQVEFVGE